MDSLFNFFHYNINDFNVQSRGNLIDAKKLRIMQWNVRGINDLNKFDDILQTIDICKVRIDVIVIGETWVSAVNSSMYNIPGYNSLFSCRDHSSGGLALFVRNDITQRLISNISVNGLHHIHVELAISGHSYDVHGLYRPPSFEFNNFYDILENILISANGNHPCFIAGDVNVPLNNANNNIVVKYKTLLQSYGFLCTNSFPTRPISNNILDHFICKLDDAHQLRNDTILSDVSDHSIIISSINLPTEKEKMLLTKKIVNHSQLHNKFKNFMNANIVNTDMDNVNNCLELVIKTYDSLLVQCTKTLTTVANVKGSTCPWMSFDLWTLIKIKNNYLKRVKRDPSNVHLNDMLKHISKKVNDMKRSCKKSFYENLLNNTPHNKFWKHLRSILGHSNKNANITLSVNNRKISNDSEVSNAFNNYFSSVGEELANKIPVNNSSPLSNVRCIPDSIYLRPASVNEVMILIKELDNNKSGGPDNISPKVLKNNSTSFAHLLSKLFNKIVETGEYPDCLKIAKVIPVFKTGNVSDINNYRPISTLSIFNKIFEKLLIRRILDFYNKHNILYRLQYGFRQGCSTLIAITELVDSIIDEVDNKNIVGALFLDLKKAFDTLNHSILLQKMERYGIRGIANRIIQSYLTNRMQYVVVNGFKSYLNPIKIGVPQGSNIGPLLFLSFINDLGNLTLRGTSRLFADDTAIFYPGNDTVTIVRDMEFDLSRLADYFSKNLLSLNLNKTKYMYFHSPRKKIAINPDPKIENITIEKVKCFKYLGILLDSTLSWKDHISFLEKKIAASCGVMWRIKNFVSRKALLSFYFAFIHSHLNYLVSIWGRACTTNLRKIQTLQNRCLKTIFSYPLLYPTLQLYSDRSHNILPISTLCDIQVIQLVHDVLNNPEMHHNLQFLPVNHLYRTRQANSLQRSRAFTNLGQNRIKFIGPTKYNQLPESLKQILHRNTFKFRLKQYFKDILFS